MNGIFATTPFSLNNGLIQVYQSGSSVVISTDFGLVVTYDTYRYVTINVPYDYQNRTCGLCGNFNYRPEDDLQTPSGEILSSELDFGNSWMAPGDNDSGCNITFGSGPEVCTTYQRNLYSNPDHCGIIANPSGPFANCHSSLPPQTYTNSCMYDLCVSHGYQPILCGTISVYATQCQQQGIQLGQWRRPGFCGKEKYTTWWKVCGHSRTRPICGSTLNLFNKVESSWKSRMALYVVIIMSAFKQNNLYIWFSKVVVKDLIETP